MSASQITFSIIVPTYNRAHLIGKTIESILRQSYKNFEILVVDDGSVDDTSEVVGRYKTEGVQYFKKENGERGAARNYGASMALGTYINFFDSDDLMYPNHLAEAVGLISAKSAPEIFHLGYDFKNEDGKVTSQVNNFDHLIDKKVLFDNKLSCNGVFLRNDIAKAFPFHEDRQLASSEDWELWIRIISKFKLHISNSITSSVVNHDQRSLYVISADKIVTRDLLLIERLKSDSTVMENYGRQFNRFIAERYTFFMLSYAEQNRRNLVFQWAVKAFRAYPLIFTSRRFLASIKNTLIK